MDSEVGSFTGVEQQVAGDDRSFCHLIESPLFTLFFALPLSVGDRYGRTSSELRWVSGVCLSTLVDDTTGSEEAPIILWGPHDSSCSLLAPETLVSGPSGISGGWSDLCTLVPRYLVSQPWFHCHHLRIDKLFLHAWRLFSDLLDPRDSPLE